MKLSISKISLVVFSAMFVVSCGPTEPIENGTTTGRTTGEVVTKERVVPPDFNSDSAYAFTKYQADLGPRVPGSKAHAAAVKWMSEKLKSIPQSGVLVE